MITVEVPMRIESMNRTAAMRSMMRRKMDQRQAVRCALRGSRVIARQLDALTFPVVVTLTRIAPRVLTDDDNLRGGCKHVRDSVARCLGVDDKDAGPIRFEYRQEKRPKTYALRIEITQQEADRG